MNENWLKTKNVKETIKIIKYAKKPKKKKF